MNERLRRGINLIAVALLLALLLYLAFVVRKALLLIFVGIVFAIIFSPWVRAIQRWRVRRWSPGRGAAVLILLFLVLAGFAIFLTFALPPIAHDVSQLAREMPQNLQALQQRLSELPIKPALHAVRAALQGACQPVAAIFGQQRNRPAKGAPPVEDEVSRQQQQRHQCQ